MLIRDILMCGSIVVMAMKALGTEGRFSYWGYRELVFSFCFDTLLGVQVRNSGEFGNDEDKSWVGEISFSTDGMYTWSPMICIDCIGRGPAFGCAYCNVAYCSSCNKMDFCEQCGISCCNSCRVRVYQEGNGHCADCIKLLPHEVALVDQSRRLQQELEQLKNEVRGLKGVNKELQDEIKDLNKKIKSMAG